MSETHDVGLHQVQFRGVFERHYPFLEADVARSAFNIVVLPHPYRRSQPYSAGLGRHFEQARHARTHGTAAREFLHREPALSEAPDGNGGARRWRVAAQ